MSRRLILGMIVLASLTACADPPGTPQPLPLNYAEETRATLTYNKWAPQFREVPGVVTSYLTANNNPRQIVVITQDDPSYVAVMKRFSSPLDGIPLVVKVQSKDSFDEDVAPEKITTIEQPKTWWGKVIFFFQNLPKDFWSASK